MSSTTNGFDFYNVGVTLSLDTKSYGFSLRCLRDTLVISVPSVSPVTFSTMTSTSTNVSAVVTPDGGAPVTERGFCWNTTGVPTAADNVVRSGLGLGTFTGTITGGLVQGPTYYVRAYATNKIGISYGTVNSFKICPDTFSIAHVAGFNGAPVSKKVLYHSVSSTMSGKAVCWTTQNLGADQQATALTDATEASAGWYWQFNRIQGYKHDGTTRTPATAWAAINETSNWISTNDPCVRLLGSGWRIPTSAEWQNVYGVPQNWTNNASAFNSVLKLHNGGYLNSSSSSLAGRGIQQGDYWSSTMSSTTNGFDFYNVGAVLSADTKSYGFSLRCLRDTLVLSTPSVSGVTLSAMTSSSVDASAIVTPDGGIPVTERGFCWNTTGNPSISDSKLTSGVGVGSFTSTINGLVQGPTYYVKAYAINKIGIAYGPVNSFKICPPVFTVQHIAGIDGAPVTKQVVYHSVNSSLSGKAVCWITQNLGADSIATAATDATEKSAGWYWQFNRIQGYKHDGMTRTPATSWVTAIDETGNWQLANDPCNRLLGSGWRIPTVTEWTNVSGAPQNWASTNDAFNSVLKLHNAGYLHCTTSVLSSRGTEGDYWSSTMINSTTASDFQFYSTKVALLAEVKSYGFSERCLRDTLVISAPSVGQVVVDASSMTGTSAGVSAAVGSDGGAPVNARGFCWNLTGNPTLSDNHITDAATGTGNFAGTITSLTEGPKYYIRAYATNTAGTAYSEGTGFNAVLTTVCPDTFNIQHTAGVRGAPVTKAVTYHAVGTYLSGAARCWITQNLGADHPASSATDATEASGGWYFQFNRSLGYKYDASTVHTPVAWTTSISEASDWTLINDPCNTMLGADWRIPTGSEWANVYGAPQNWANYTDAYNSVLKIHGAGYVVYNTGALVYRGGDDDYWSSTGATNTAGVDFGISAGRIGVFNTNSKADGFSIRCLRDALVKMPPSMGAVIVPTATMTDSTAQGTATILQDGSSAITERGLCWNTTGIPTITDHKVIYSASDMTYTSLMTGLTAGVTYYVRAYAMNKIGLSYSSTVTSFKKCNPVSTVHVAGFNGAPVSKTVTYGTVATNVSGKLMCWTTQNLGADHQAVSATDATEPSGGWYWQFNRSQGYQYTTSLYPTIWAAINESSDWVPANDPCCLLLGSGWRIPTSLEYTTADGAPQNWANLTNAYNSILKLHAAGYLTNGGMTSRGIAGEYWSSTQTNATTGIDLGFDATVCNTENNIKSTYGFSLRCIRDSVLVSKPSVSNVTINGKSKTAVMATAAATPDGGAPVTARGFCWNTTGNPTTADHIIPEGNNTGAFTDSITGLAEGTTYYIRAYATNRIGIAYSSTVKQFKVCPPVFTVQHIAGIDGAPVSKVVTYNSVSSTLSGKAVCWITQNLGADHQATVVTDATEPSAGWYWQFNRIQGYKHDGTTRTPATSWITAVDEPGNWQLANDPCNRLLGSGWRIPTSIEWTNVSGAPQNWVNYTDAFNSILKLHNSGYLSYITSALNSRGTEGNYWSSTMISSTTASDFQIYNTNVVLLAEVKSYGFSARCLRDTIVIAAPSVGQVAVDASSMTGTSAAVSAAAGSDGGAPVSARGFCWNLTGNPTLSDNHITDAAIGTGTFAGTITGLTVGPKYYIRAYATNSAGTAYSEGTGFNAVLTSICPDTFNIQHAALVRGAPVTKAVTYHAVQTSLSGAAQCWITQNLGADHPATSAADATEASAGWYFQFNRSLGYKHDGTTRTPVAWITSISEASDWTPINDPCSIMLGVGWRLPTSTEWSKAHGAPQNWASYADSYNSVLKIHGAGYLSNGYLSTAGSLASRGSEGNYWSSTAASNVDASAYEFYSALNALTNVTKAYGYSVRCLR